MCIQIYIYIYTYVCVYVDVHVAPPNSLQERAYGKTVEAARRFP